VRRLEAWVKMIHEDRSTLSQSVIMVLGNKIDSNRILEEEMKEVEQIIRNYHRDVRGECTVAVC